MNSLGLESRPRLRKFLVGVIGCSVVFVGVCMIVLPGPAIIVLPLGFAILATEFAWARRVWRRGKVFVGRVRSGGKMTIRETRPGAPEGEREEVR
ncbi:MAG: PGPGW domain-containing protein [Verrucomicrobia bacterium]|nr:PGPGW domain-containing protein [Verrucomicrobiota bacterium]